MNEENISTCYQDAKESTKHGANLQNFHGLSHEFMNFHEFFWFKSKLHPRTEISAIATLTPKSSIDMRIRTPFEIP